MPDTSNPRSALCSASHPTPYEIYPILGARRVVYLKNIITNPQIVVGDYTYYDDPDDVHNFEKNVLYLFDFIGDKLIIGNFCQIATGVRFIMNGGNHGTQGFSTYPFKVFGGAWATADLTGVNKGNTVVGHDVWFGNGTTILPGVKIGDGAIIGAGALVSADVAPYAIVAGNPAREIRKRFSPKVIELLLQLQWWHWDAEKIAHHLDVLTQGDEVGLKKLMALDR